VEINRDMSWFIQIARAWLPAVLIVLSSAGCGGPATVAVRGQVTFEGQPLEQGDIAFIPDRGTAGVSEGAQIRNGQYELSKGLVVGNYSVEIHAWKHTGKRVKGPYGETDERVNLLPKQYSKNSSLRFTSADDPDHLDFHLTKDEIGKPRREKGVRGK
jgi:hypothetical protein